MNDYCGGSWYLFRWPLPWTVFRDRFWTGEQCKTVAAVNLYGKQRARWQHRLGVQSAVVLYTRCAQQCTPVNAVQPACQPVCFECRTFAPPPDTCPPCLRPYVSKNKKRFFPAQHSVRERPINLTRLFS